MKRPIGLFDSGVGGLTVLSELKRFLPHEDIIYIGDNKHCPYGEKTKEQLLEYTKNICQYFIDRNVKMIVLACNTTSANVLDELQVLFPQVKIVGVIHSTVYDFLKKNYESVLIIATHATITSHKYRELIHQYNDKVKVYELETPKLVPLIESGEYKKGIHQTLQEYLLPYQDKVQSLILGCTHYPIVQNQIQDVFDVKAYISSSHSICREVMAYLEVHHLNNKEHQRKIEIYTIGDVNEFRFSSEGFYDYKQEEVQYLDI